MCGSCLFYPEWQAIICQFRQIIGVAKGYSAPPPYKIIGGGGGLAPAAPPPCSYAYVNICDTV